MTNHGNVVAKWYELLAVAHIIISNPDEKTYHIKIIPKKSMPICTSFKTKSLLVRKIQKL
jgi:hypothetical protein